MTQYANTFEGGSNGTTLTPANSGGGSGDAFDGVTIGAGATGIFDNTHPAHGSLGLKLATGATNTTVTVVKQLPAAGANGALRLYLYVTGTPTSTIQLANFRNSAGTTRLSLRWTTAGKLAIFDAAGTQVAITANQIPRNQQVRVELYGITFNASTGAATLDYYRGDSNSADESISVSSQNFGGTADRVAFGLVATNTTNQGPFWLDDFAVNDTGAQIGSSVSVVAAGESWGMVPI